jgi:hypothetical protein
MACIGVAEELRQDPLVWLDRLQPMAPHVLAEADDQLSEIAAMGHDKHVRLQANQKVKCSKAGYMLLEMLYFLLACKIFFGHLQSTMKIDQLSLEIVHLPLGTTTSKLSQPFLLFSILNW